MRLDAECIRDILLCVEENTGLRNYCFFTDSGLEDVAKWTGDVTPPPSYQDELLQKYGNDMLIYHVKYCIEASLISPVSGYGGYKIMVADLTPTGHDLLAKIRDTKQWAAVKKGLSVVRDYSLSAISSVAEGVTSAAINAYFQK